MRLLPGLFRPGMKTPQPVVCFRSGQLVVTQHTHKHAQRDDAPVSLPMSPCCRALHIPRKRGNRYQRGCLCTGRSRLPFYVFQQSSTCRSCVQMSFAFRASPCWTPLLLADNTGQSVPIRCPHIHAVDTHCGPHSHSQTRPRRTHPPKHKHVHAQAHIAPGGSKGASYC